MSAWLSALLVLQAAGSGGVPAPPPTSGPVRVMVHDVNATRIEIGARTDERLVVLAPDGVRVTVTDDDGAGAGAGAGAAERQGVWRVRRTPRPGGMVRWSWSAPLTAWDAGVHSTPGLRVHFEGKGGSGELRVVPVAFRVVSPLPKGARSLRTAPPEGPPTDSGGGGWPVWLLAFQGLFAAAVGVAWWRSGREAGADGVAATPTVAEPEPSLVGILRDWETDPSGAAIALSRALRRHPRLWSLGVRGSHTRPEILERVADEVELEGLDALLRMADGVAYGGYRPGVDEVRRLAGPVIGRLEDV